MLTSAAGAWWLFSPRLDIVAFGGSALLAFIGLLVGAKLGLLHSESPEWAWMVGVLLVDVAHVWSSIFRVYLDPQEWARRRVLYAAVPLLAWGGGVVLYHFGPGVFWRVLAYLAVFHFVRQQFGWVLLYRVRLRERDPWTFRLDAAAIYFATIYPLVWWHAHLPRQFWWFMRDDFAAVPELAAQILEPIYWTVLTAYFVYAAVRWVKRCPNPGKDLVVLTTALCWHIGIITFNSDYAFTVTNVLIHGIPYLVLVYIYARSRVHRGATAGGLKLAAHAPFLALSLLWVLAYCEELLWDATAWHERAWLFGSHDLSAWQAILVPLLAVPQATHYILDGFIWRRRSNPDLELIPLER